MLARRELEFDPNSPRAKICRELGPEFDAIRHFLFRKSVHGYQGTRKYFPFKIHKNCKKIYQDL